MKYIDEFRNASIIKSIKNKIQTEFDGHPVNFMEVCGGHTHAICKFGIRDLLPQNINLISGPGCPVCVTEKSYIDKAVKLAKQKNVIIATFGDMVKVPGSQGSLKDNRQTPDNIKICYSPMESIQMSQENPDREIVFLAVGFETTAPAIASSVIQANKQSLDNFSILPGNKTMPAAMEALLQAKDVRIDGFICPGHVSTITGTGIYDFIPEKYEVPCVISGFEPVDIMATIYQLINQINTEKPKVQNQYKRSVRQEGNLKALRAIEQVFENSSAIWRGLGEISNSGLQLRPKYKSFDANKKFDIKIETLQDNSACICGEIMRGAKLPTDCSLFETVCTPETPEGPCMVSSEGACAAFYHYQK